MALLTVLNISQHETVPGMNQLLAHLMAKASKADETAAAQMQQLLENENNQVGLVINNRLLNTPYEVVDPLYRCLQNDIKANLENKDLAEDKKKFYKFTHFLFVTKVQEGGSGGKLKKVNPNKKKRTKRMLEEAIYPNFEEQVFMQNSEFKFTFGRTQKQLTAIGQHSFGEQRLIFCVEKSKFDEVVKKLDGLHPAMLSDDIVA